MTNSTRRGWGVSVTRRPLSTPGKNRYPLYRRLRWAPRPVWTGAENQLPPTGIQSLDLPARSQSLYRLRYPAHLVYGGHNEKAKHSRTHVCMKLSLCFCQKTTQLKYGRLFQKPSLFCLRLKQVIRELIVWSVTTYPSPPELLLPVLLCVR